MACNDCSTNSAGDGGCAWPSSKLDDFTQSSWYTNLYSPFNSAILETNESPSVGQIASLQAHYLEAITELEKVDQKIQTIQSILSDAISHRTRLKKVIDDYRSTLSPIRRVPFEIVHRILQNVDTKDSANLRHKPNLHMSLYNGPWRFGMVCRLWRAVAIQSPEFWCNIQLDFGYNRNRASEYWSSGLCALVDEGIRRSTSWGLWVRLHQYDLNDDKGNDSDEEQDEDEDEDSGREEDHDVMMALFAHSSQIRALEIEVQDSYELEHIIPSSSCGFTSLQRLSIQIFAEWDRGTTILEAFGGSSSLVEVKLIGLVVGKPCQDLNFPWSQLQVFEHINSLSPEDIVDVVRICPRLQKYTASSPRPGRINLMVIPPIIHHAVITHLELRSRLSYLLLNYTTIPSLTVLRISSNIRLPDLIQFISRSQCSIEECDFSPIDTSLEKYNNFLELLPSLTRLTLRLENITQLHEFQSALTLQRLTRLKALEIWVHGSYPDPLALCTPGLMSTLIHIIQSRSSSLQSFTFNQSIHKVSNLRHEASNRLRALLVPYNQQLRAWIKGGMKLHLCLGTCSSFQSPYQYRSSELMDVHDLR
jgi:hypothetical protein